MTLTRSVVTQQSPSSRRKRRPKDDDSDVLDRLSTTPWQRFSKHLLICLLGVIMLYPLLWLLSASIKPDTDIFRDLSLIPKEFDFTHYGDAWNALSQPFHVFLLNSLLIAVLSIVGNLISCAMAAFAFSRLEFRGRKLFFGLMLGTLMLPAQVLLVPQYILFSELGWLNTYLPLIVPTFLATNAFFVFLMVQFMRALPQELDDAARIDGCGSFGIFFRIVVPLCKPAFATTAIFTFISSWNEFFGPLLYLTDPKLYTVPLALSQFMNAEGMSSWGQVFAMSVIALAPVVGFFFVGQKHLVQGIATTGLK